jgi:glycosyltransferase involved in cell wall biosynthesis
LRVGILGSVPDATAGGASTLLESLVKALQRAEGRHAFIWGTEPPPREAVDAVVSDQIADRRLKYLQTKARAWLGNNVARGIRLRRPASPIARSLLMDEWIRTHEIDVVWFLAPFNSGASVPYITTVWDLEHRSKPYFPEVNCTGWNWEAREQTYVSALPRASFILTGTHAGKNEIVQYYRVNADNVVVVPFPAPPVEALHKGIPDIQEKYKLRGDFLIYPAQFWPHKNHVNLLLALALLKEHEGMKVEIVFTGSNKGNAGHVLEKIGELGLEEQVHILGFVPREDLMALYSKALALTFASFFGPDNIPPLEAFALGCPVIASRVSGAQEQLGDAALLFDPANPEELASAILTISRDQKMRERMIKRGGEIAKSRTPQAYVERVCKILDRFEPIRRCWGHDYEHT